MSPRSIPWRHSLSSWSVLPTLALAWPHGHHRLRMSKPSSYSSLKACLFPHALSHEMTTPLAQLTKPENCHHLCSSICLTLYIQPYAKFFLLIYYFSISQNYSLLSTLEATTLVFTITVSCLEGCQLQWWSASILAPSSTFSTLQPRELSIMQIWLLASLSKIF